MRTTSVEVKVIGRVESPLKELASAPRQGDEGAPEAWLVFDADMLPALDGLCVGDEVIAVTWLHRARRDVLAVHPRGDASRPLAGVFSTRSPHRPNPIGLSALRLLRVDGLDLHVLDVDLLDGTPVLDIKPYVAYTDAFPASGSGWLQPGAADPGKSYAVTFSPEAEKQLAWIAARSPLPLRERIAATLRLGPQPHPYRRIKRSKEGGMMLAVQDWRATFQVEDSLLNVSRIHSGYTSARMAEGNPDPSGILLLHREFTMAFG